MKIEQGKYYLTADGSKVGPMYGFNFKWVKYMVGDDDPEWENDGRGIDGAPDLIAEWTDEPRPWKDLTDAEKGALLLAHHEGTTLQYYNKVLGFWSDTDPTFHPMDILRIKPEPARETVTLYDECMTIWSDYERCDSEYRITFDLVDGVPDCASIKMEKL